LKLSKNKQHWRFDEQELTPCSFLLFVCGSIKNDLLEQTWIEGPDTLWSKTLKSLSYNASIRSQLRDINPTADIRETLEVIAPAPQ